jgi:phosphohistidine phosphatase SixA
MRTISLASVTLLVLAGLPLALALAAPRAAGPVQAPTPAAPAPSSGTSDASRAETAAALAAPRTVILLRHAEKEAAPKDPRDPSLSAAGAARAQELARLLGASGASRLYSSEFRRTAETLAPLSQGLSVPVEAVSAGKPKELLLRLDALPPGSVAVVCGHSNTIPQVAELLGVELTALVQAQGTAMLADEAYDRIFVVTRPAAGPAGVVELGYGARAASTSSAGR